MFENYNSTSANSTACRAMQTIYTSDQQHILGERERYGAGSRCLAPVTSSKARSGLFHLATVSRNLDMFKVNELLVNWNRYNISWSNSRDRQPNTTIVSPWVYDIQSIAWGADTGKTSASIY